MKVYMICLRCKMSLIGESLATGFCIRCRVNLIPSHIPEQQHKRYLKRIGAYEKYNKGKLFKV